MDWNWLHLRPNDSWIVLTEQPLQIVEVGVLTHLYQPIIGVDAVGLYVTLSLQVHYHAAGNSSMHTHRYLMGLVGLPLDRLLEARHRLEAVGLLKVSTIKEEFGKSYVYHVIPPLSPDGFFKTDVLAVTLLNRLGKEQFRRVKERFYGSKQRQSKMETGEDITKKFHEVFTSISPSELVLHEDSEAKHLIESLEPAPTREQAATLDFSGYPLDWEFLSAQASPVGSIDHLSESERAKIQEWAFFYQLKEIELGKALQNPGLYDSQNKLQLDKLRSYIRQEYRYRFERLPDVREVPSVSKGGNQTDTLPPSAETDPAAIHRQWLMKLSPLELLERYHRGGKVPDADIELVEMLRDQYGLPNGVINVLIEFVLLTNDYKLPRALVEKVAGHWRRANVKTVEEAQALALKQLEPSQTNQTARQHKRSTKPIDAKKRAAVPRERPQKKRLATGADRHEWQEQFNKLLRKLRETGARERE